MNGFPNLAVLFPLLIVGLTGSLGHCLGMCGPLVLVVSSRFSGRGIKSTPEHLLYHTGRIGVYALLGLLAGFAGQATGGILRSANLLGLISLILGAVIILAGLIYLGWVRIPGGQRLSTWWQNAMKKMMKMPGRIGILLLGMLNGLLPCGLVASALLLSAATGNALLGALGMVVFGLGTIPALLTFGLGANMLSLKWRRTLAHVSGVFVILVGIQLLLRGTAGLGLISHFMLPGKVMIW